MSSVSVGKRHGLATCLIWAVLMARYLCSILLGPSSGRAAYRSMPLKSRARHRARRRVGDTSLATWTYASSPSPVVRAVRWATIPRHRGDYESSDPFSLLGLSATVVPAPSASWDPSWSLLT